MRRVTLEAFIFHAATSVPFQPLPDYDPNIELALTLAERALQDMFSRGTPDHPDSPVLGVPPSLFLLIREISLIHLKHEEAYNPGRCLHLLSEIEEIETELSASLNLDPTDAICGDSMKPGFHDSVVPYAETLGANHTFFIGPQLYIVSAKMLLTDIAMRYSQASPYDMHKLVREGMSLVQQLQPSVDYYAEYYSWPLQVLTRFVSCQQDRDLLLAKVQRFWDITRCGTMRRLADILIADSGRVSSCR